MLLPRLPPSRLELARPIASTIIASRLRKHEALSVIVPCDEPLATFGDAGAIIVSGGPQSVLKQVLAA